MPLAALLGLALPPRCPGCGAVTTGDHQFCRRCWSELDFLGRPWCTACHAPLEVGPERLCDACLVRRPGHDGVRAAVGYGPISSAVALRLKYGGRLALAATMARAMARLMPAEADLLIPVPLHRWRLWRRGFNQAALIAAALARLSGVPDDPLLLVRTRRTPPLRGLNPGERVRAVAGAFAVRREPVPARIVLVDDVYTSGATASACAAVLKAAGAQTVTILCWARVLGERDD